MYTFSKRFDFYETLFSLSSVRNIFFSPQKYIESAFGWREGKKDIFVVQFTSTAIQPAVRFYILVSNSNRSMLRRQQTESWAHTKCCSQRFRARVRTMAVIWNRVLWPFSSALNIYGIYYLENRRKQAKIQGNIHNGIDTFYMEKEKKDRDQHQKLRILL